jgi:hypothetical protein
MVAYPSQLASAAHRRRIRHLALALYLLPVCGCARSFGRQDYQE